MEFRYINLSEICNDMHQGINTVADKVEYKEMGIPIIQSKNITSGFLDLIDARYLSVEDYDKYKAKYKPNKGDILLCNIGTIGKSLVLEDDEDFLIAWNLFKLTINTDLYNPKYIGYYLERLRLINYFDKLMNGGTVKFINKKKLSEIKIPICSLGQQNKIVQVLDKAKELIDKRKEQIEALDELVKSKFVDMFGDPINNPKNFEMLTVDDVVEFQGGSQPDKKYFEYKKTDNNIRLIQIRDYKSDAYITYIPKNMAKRFCSADDIMIGRYGPPIFQILKGIEGSYNVALLKATPKRGNKEFIRAFLKQECLFNYLDKLSQRTAGQSGIDMPKLKQYPFPYPPIELQNNFEKFANRVENLKFEMEKSLKELEDNFNSLMQKAFKGELFN